MSDHIHETMITYTGVIFVYMPKHLILGSEPRISALNELEETICKLHWMYHHSTYKPVISCDFDVNTIKLRIGVCTLSPYSLYNCNLNMFRSIIQIVPVSRHTAYGPNCMYIEIKKHLQI